MYTDCNGQTYFFQPLRKSDAREREVVAQFNGGAISSDGGGLLLREVDERFGLLRQFAGCFTDHRDPNRIEHTVEELLAQRIYGLALGYEDLNDHDSLRHDPLLATLAGKSDPTGRDRRRVRERGKSLAGKSTLNRLELTLPTANAESRYKKIVMNFDAIDQTLLDLFLQLETRPRRRYVLDIDATDDPLHGHQEGRFFHGYYACYCYLPLYIFCEDFPLCARLRPGNVDPAKGCVEELARIVSQLRHHRPEAEIVVRGDSGFCREELLAWCERNQVHYILGLAKNTRLVKSIEPQMKKAMKRSAKTGQPERVFRDFRYRTRQTWSRTRRVVGKAEYLYSGKANPRFVVTSYSQEEFKAQKLYEQEYCGRGEMENRIKEQQLDLFADRTSTHEIHSNQIRLYFSTLAYVLMTVFRRVGLAGTDMEKAQCHTIRTRLLKIGALVSVSVRRVWVRLAGAYPFQQLFARIYSNLQRAGPVSV